MVAYIDIHGVLANVAQAVVTNYNNRHETNWAHDDVKNWDWSPVIPNNESWLEYTRTQNFWATLPLYPWAKDLVSYVNRSSYTCAFLSDLPNGTETEHRIWLDKHFGSKASEHLIITKRKELVANHKDCVVFEDGPFQIKAIRSAGGRVYALAQPWNEAEIVGRYSPEEILEIARTL